ncbi:hypothetical protein CG709_03275 [Lachnotalea glycerini]|nr:hypothetical protein CG709_03275 [Lachnotalea glycerini]
MSNYYSLQNNDEVVMRNYYTVAQILEFMDVEIDFNTEIFVNNKPADLDEKVYENFTINWTFKSSESYEKENVNEAVQSGQNHEENEVWKEDKLEQNEEIVNLNITVNKKAVTLKGKNKYVFVDIFDWIDFDLRNSKGREIVTLLNGEKTKYTQELHAADRVEIYWKE